MTPVRTRKGKRMHLSADLRNTLCNRHLVAPIVEPNESPNCIRCLEVEADIARGN